MIKCDKCEFTAGIFLSTKVNGPKSKTKPLPSIWNAVKLPWTERCKWRKTRTTFKLQKLLKMASIAGHIVIWVKPMNALWCSMKILKGRGRLRVKVSMLPITPHQLTDKQKNKPCTALQYHTALFHHCSCYKAAWRGRGEPNLWLAFQTSSLHKITSWEDNLRACDNLFRLTSGPSVKASEQRRKGKCWRPKWETNSSTSSSTITMGTTTEPTVMALDNRLWKLSTRATKIISQINTWTVAMKLKANYKGLCPLQTTN